MTGKTGIMVCGHGSRNQNAVREFAVLAERMRERFPGMPVEAYIRTDDRTPMNYLIKPIADYFNKAFRES